MTDTPDAIRACWLSWIAVQAGDPADVVQHLALTDVRAVPWNEGSDLVDANAHDRECFFNVVVSPAIEGWTLVFGFWGSLLHLENVIHITELCQDLSAHFGKAQAYFTSEQNDGEAWLIVEDGAVTRRFITEYPELALGEPFGAERRRLDAAGITGKPEDLDPDSDEAADWLDGTHCFATEVAAESSLDPTSIGPDTPVVGPMLVAKAPAFELKDPLTGTAPYLGKSRISQVGGPPG